MNQWSWKVLPFLRSQLWCFWGCRCFLDWFRHGFLTESWGFLGGTPNIFSALRGGLVCNWWRWECRPFVGSKPVDVMGPFLWSWHTNRWDWPSEPSGWLTSDLEGSGCCCNEMEKEHHVSSLIELVLMALKFISVSHRATIFNAFIQHLGVHTGVSAGAPGKVKATCIAIGDSSGTEAIRLGSCCFNYDFRRLLSYSQSWDSSTICLLVAGCMTEVS